MSSVIWSFVKYCASFHLMYYLCACHLCLPNATSNCFALNSGTLILLLHLNIWRFLLLLSHVCVCFPLIKGNLIILVILRCCRQTSTLLRLIKHFCDLCINFSHAAGRCLFGFLAAFQWEGPKQWWIEEVFLMLCRVCTVVLW